MASELTEKQKIFCREYILDWNAARAAIVAGYSEASARQTGYEILTKPYIQAYIKEIQADLEKVAGISRLKVLREHERLAFSSIAHLHLTWLTRREFDDLTPDEKACISEISTQIRKVQLEGGITQEVEFVKIKLYDKQKALDSITKMMGYDSATKIDHTSLGEKLSNTILVSREEAKAISEALEKEI
jgi:phage terminase small subunit